MTPFFGITRIFFFFIAGAMLWSCAPSQLEEPTGDSEPKSIEDMRAEAWEKIDHDACARKGGEVRQEGMLGLPRCVVDYADAGNICTDAADCQGRCLGSDDVTDYTTEGAGNAKGRCEADDSPFGCYAEINNGVVRGMICVD